MNRYAHIAGRIYDAPLAITLEKAEQWERVIRDRMEGSGDAYEAAALTSRVVAVDRLQALAQDHDARPLREGYALTDSGIAIVPIHGSLVQRGGFMEAMSGITGYNEVARQLRAADRNPDVRGIVLDVDSPGGEVAGMFELADTIASLEKPTRSIANDIAASAAYTIASAAGKMYATRTSIVGSIGILMMHADRSKAHEKQGVRYTPIFAGKRKVEGSSLGPLTDEARSAAQARIDSAYDMLVEAVAKQRGMSAQAVRDTEAGILQSDDAEALGLIDGVSTLGQVISEFAAELSAPQRTEQRPRAAASAELSNGGTAMTDSTNKPAAQAPAAITPEQLASAEAAARASASAAERSRVKAITEHPEARGREGLAAHFAHDTDMTPEAAGVALSKAPKIEPKADTPSRPLADAMANTPNPEVAASASSEEDSEEKAAARIVSHLRPRNAAAK